MALLIDLIGAEFRLDLLHFLCKNQTPIWAEASPQGGYKKSVGEKTCTTAWTQHQISPKYFFPGFFCTDLLGIISTYTVCVLFHTEFN